MPISSSSYGYGKYQSNMGGNSNSSKMGFGIQGHSSKAGYGIPGNKGQYNYGSHGVGYKYGSY